MRTWGLPASIVVHGLLLLAFAIPLSLRDMPPLNESTPVEVWTGEEFRELETSTAPPIPQNPEPFSASHTQPDPAIQPAPSAEPPPQTAPAVIRATKMLSGDVLSHPASRKMQQMLPLMEEETRLEQLCNIEAMAQIAAALKQFEPERIVAYAMADTRRSRNTIVAKGAAFRSGSSWYNLSYTCQLDLRSKTVRSFELAVGETIPKRLWEQHNLPSPEFDRD